MMFFKIWLVACFLMMWAGMAFKPRWVCESNNHLQLSVGNIVFNDFLFAAGFSFPVSMGLWLLFM